VLVSIAVIGVVGFVRHFCVCRLRRLDLRDHPITRVARIGLERGLDLGAEALGLAELAEGAVEVAGEAGFVVAEQRQIFRGAGEGTG